MSSDGNRTGRELSGEKRGESQRFNVILEKMEQFEEAVKTVNTRKKFHVETPETKQNPGKQSKTINLCTKGNAIIVQYWLCSA